MSTATKQRQLNLDELRRLKWLLGGAMALISLWTVFFLDVEALSLVAFTSAAVVAVLIWPEFPAKVPAVVWKLAVPAIIAAAAVDFYLSPDVLPVFIRLAILLVFYRTVSHRRKREDLQLIVLSLFLIVVAGVLTVSLGFAFLLLLFTACALGFLFVINLIDASEISLKPDAEANLAWARLDARKFFGRLRSVADWRMLGFAAALFTAVVVMSGVLFLIIPRFEIASGFFLDRYITRKSRTGFTDNLKFGDVTELVRDQSVAMRVDVTDSAGLTERPFWRMVVLDEYTPQGFKVSAGLKNELLRNQGVTQRVNGRSFGRTTNTVGGMWTFYIEPGVSRYLPLPGSFGMLRLRDPMPLQTSAAQRVLALRSEPMSMSAFQLEGVDQNMVMTDARFPQLLKEARATPSKFAEQLRYNPLVTLAGPTGAQNEAVLKRIIHEINGGEELSVAEFSRRASEWLAAHHAYALSAKLPDGEGKDDIVRWLDSKEPGFCEYFAAGFTVLARSAGYPTRVISGFYGGVLNAFENYYMVRNSDAHAWAEIYDEKGSTWLRINPTPGASNDIETVAAQIGGQQHDSSWTARWDSLRVLWYRRIVNFDSRAQVEMLEQVKSFTVDSSSAIRKRIEELSKDIKAWLGKPWDKERVGKAAGLAIGGAAFVWLFWRLGRWGWQRLRRWKRPQEFDPVRRAAGRWLATFHEQPEAAQSEVIADLQRLRYGKRETWLEPQGVFKRAKQARRAARR